MSKEVHVKNIGLRGVTVADSAISFIDGEQGVLIYRGYRIEDLADHSTFMETAYLLLHGSLPTREEVAGFSEQVRAARELPDFLYACMKRWPVTAHPMDVLQAAVPLLAMADGQGEALDRDRYLANSIGLIAKLPTITAAWHRIRHGQEPLAPDDSLDHAANFLWMLQGEKPHPETAHDLDVCLILHADHTFNASTFAAREVVSTRASIYAGVTAALGALSGSLHGGANTRVMQMLLELEDEDDVAAWVHARLAQGKKVMGFGHAIYKTGDPRAAYLKKMGKRLGDHSGQNWFTLSQQVEDATLAEFRAKGKTTILPNVDFMSAPVYHMMGIPLDVMTPIFAFSRVAGWCSHIIEEQFADAQGKPALYRPKAEYVGEYCGLMGCEYSPPEERG
ncbi:citrate synthase [Desulfogranum mediterraneum]|uniref:citrate synthase n=1 Tax=Desulfogranum mediterraneum TaxID=160661 RepID=UPI0004917D8C|nr:citrate synthase [Desulfogranum mediterraneum]